MVCLVCSNFIFKICAEYRYKDYRLPPKERNEFVTGGIKPVKSGLE
jgi:hypothetical protein